MMNYGSGKRDEWEFEYTAAKLAEGAEAQRKFRLSRVEWWTEAKAKLMVEIRESGLEVNESVAAQAGYISNSTVTRGLNAPTINVRHDLQQKLAECHSKIQAHQQAAAEYDGWVQVLSATAADDPEKCQKLTQADWLYFFGKV